MVPWQRSAHDGIRAILAAVLFLVCAVLIGVCVLFGRLGAGSSPRPTIAALPPEDSDPKEIAIDVVKEFQFAPKGFPMGLSAGQTDLPRWSSVRPTNIRKAPPVPGDILYVTLPLGNVEEQRISVAMVNRRQLFFDDNGNGDFMTTPRLVLNPSAIGNLMVSVRKSDGSIQKRPYTGQVLPVAGQEYRLKLKEP